MALDSPLAKLLQHISAVHSAVLPGDRLVFRAGPHHIGFLPPDLATKLAALEPSVTVTPGQVTLPLEKLPDLNRLATLLGLPSRHENFDIRETAEGPVLGVLDRGALPSFGVIGVGVHLNGLVHRTDGWHVWVGKRAADKKLDPSKLDNLVAGGVPAGFTPLQTLIKEGEEEASLPEALVRNARQVGRFSYDMEREEGLRRDVVYIYDLELPENFQPHPADGEVEHFELWSLPRVLKILATTDDFKFNVALVLTDLLIRFGVIEGKAAATLRAALDR